MPLSEEKLARIQQGFKRAQSIYEQGSEFKPKSGTFEFRLREIPGAQDYVFQEIYEHQHPGNQKGFGYCSRSMGLPNCYYCDLIDSLVPYAEADPALQNYLSQMSTGKPKYAFEVLYRELDSDVWVGPQMWKMRLDMFLKFQPYFSKRWGDPTEIAYEVTLLARKKLFNGKPVYDINSVAPITDPEPLPDEVSTRRPIKIMQLLQQRDPESLTELLLDGPIGPYLRRLLESDTSVQASARPSSRSVDRSPHAAPSDPTPPPKEEEASVEENPSSGGDHGVPPQASPDEASPKDASEPKYKTVRKVVSDTNAPNPSPTVSPLARARALMGSKGGA
jgi:hypothetical protein